MLLPQPFAQAARRSRPAPMTTLKGEGADTRNSSPGEQLTEVETALNADQQPARQRGRDTYGLKIPARHSSNKTTIRSIVRRRPREPVVRASAARLPPKAWH